MGKLLEIYDTNQSGVLTPTLGDILNLFFPRGSKLVWSILEIEARGDLGENRSVPEFEKEIASSPRGLLLNWSELISLSCQLWEIIDTTIVGCKDVKLIPALIPGQDLYTPSEVVIEVIDSSLWRIYSKDLEAIRQLMRHYKYYREI